MFFDFLLFFLFTSLSFSMGCFGGNLGKSPKRKDHIAGKLKTEQIIEPEEQISHLVEEEASSNSKNEQTKQFVINTIPFEELDKATNSFSNQCFLGEGGFGRVYIGILRKTNQVVAIKKLNLNGRQGDKEFLVEASLLTQLRHPNLVKLISCCVHKDQRLLVYEYLPLGSLDLHLHDASGKDKVLEWNTRMRIAFGVAKGLEYLHVKAHPPVVYRDMKSSNILLGDDYTPKLSDFGLARLAPTGNKTHVFTRTVGTYGYCAPEYVTIGRLSRKSDIYGFGVVLLELITGRRAYDKVEGSPNLVAWAKPLLKDKANYYRMVDPNLEGQFSKRGLKHAFCVAGACILENPKWRPTISDVILGLSRVLNS